MTGLSGKFSGVLDRVVDNETAVVLVEDDETQAELTLPIADLPEHTTEGAILDLVLEDGEVTEIHYREEKTRNRHDDIQDRLDTLSRNLSEDSS